MKNFMVNRLILLLSIFLSFNVSYSQVPINGLVAEYLFDYDAADSGPFNIHGAVHNVELSASRFGVDFSAYLFSGSDSYIEIPDNDIFSVSTTGELSISVWMRPDVLNFPNDELNSYIHWMGKGNGSGTHEWTFRLYNQSSSDRPNRTSFYLFNLNGGLGAGSYVQEPLTVGEWIHYVAVANIATDHITWYKNGEFKDSDAIYNSDYLVTPENGNAPVRIGTRDFNSFFKGAIDDIRFYNRALDQDEILKLFNETPDTAATDSKKEFSLTSNKVSPIKTSSGKIEINTKGLSSHIKIYNAIGRQVYSTKTDKQNLVVLTNEIMVSGMIIITISNEHGSLLFRTVFNN